MVVIASVLLNDVMVFGGCFFLDFSKFFQQKIMKYYVQSVS